MPDCDYCSADLDGEEAYLEHLEDEHYDELSRIDRRRVDENASESGTSTGQVAAIAVGAVLVIGLVLFVGDAAGFVDVGGLLGDGGDGEDAGLLDDVETYEPSSREHVPAAQDIQYPREPPTSGPHYGGVTSPGFYDQAGEYGQLVHNLEHGHVVIYYEPSALSSDAEESLRQFTASYTDTWAAVVVVQNPKENPESDYVLTAWGARLRMDSYDAQVVEAFVDEYVGRGPENPVR